MKLSDSAILLLDNHLLVINKPAPLLTQPNGSLENSLEELGKEWLKVHFHKPGNVFLTPIHRLDKPTSGIVICARTSKAAARLSAQLRLQKVTKNYLALCEGELPHSTYHLEDYLVHGDHSSTVGSAQSVGAQLASLTYHKIRYHRGYTLLRVELHSGRYHQIRAQMAHHGYPIVGDRVYGAISKYSEGAIGLHHFRCSFLHPITVQEVHVEAAPPSFFKPYIGYG